MPVDTNGRNDTPLNFNTQRVVRCPGCGGDSIYAPSNPSRPFCSERCKNMDFGAWASESFRVATQANAEGLDAVGNTLQ
jgi:endogenous inhibitor of DNA gyrase (YacG/DUF329 family)